MRQSRKRLRTIRKHSAAPHDVGQDPHHHAFRAHPPVSPEVEFSHPARGGYPALTDEQLNALIDYVMTLGTS